MPIEPYVPARLPPLLGLVNLHLAAVAPGWSLSPASLARHLERDETEFVTDPWVVERTTLVAVEADRLVGAVHLLRYADTPDVGASFRGLGEIGWALALPAAGAELADLVWAARARFAAWGVPRESGWGAGLPAGPFGGVPDVWPHVAAALRSAGYVPDAAHREALYGGSLVGIPDPGPSPLAGVRLERTVGAWGVRFAALLDGEEVGFAEGSADLTQGGAVPAPTGWAEMAELWVREEWRNRGIGRWLVEHLAAWLRLAGGERIVLSVAAAAEAAGAGRFYARCGWQPLTRSALVWNLVERHIGS